MKNKRVLSMLARYMALLAISIPGLDIFYSIFLPLTKYPVFLGLKIFYDPVLIGTSIFVKSKAIEISGACIAGSAYYLLLILILSTPNISIKNRLMGILASFGVFFVVNAIRIYVLGIMYFENSIIFDATHKAFWYFGSTIFVVLIWFSCVYFFKIKKVPFYDDIKFIYNMSSLKKRKLNRKK